MTLIITCVRQREILMTSDSRATFYDPKAVRRFDDTFPKIFPMSDHPLVIGHQGENDLAGKPLEEFIGTFYSQLNAGNMTITDVIDHLRSYAHPAVRKRLRELPIQHHGCGFMVAGFGADDSGPQAAEVFWRRTTEAIICEERHWYPPSILTSGEGAGQIEKVDWHKVDKPTLEQVEQYVDNLFDEAVHAKVDPNTVGGPLQRIVVRREGWEWIAKPPARGKPATRPTTRTQP